MRSMILALCLAAPAQAQTASTGLPDALAALAGARLMAGAGLHRGGPCGKEVRAVHRSVRQADKRPALHPQIVARAVILAPRLIPASQRRSGDHMSRKG